MIGNANVSDDNVDFNVDSLAWRRFFTSRRAPLNPTPTSKFFHNFMLLLCDQLLTEKQT